MHIHDQGLTSNIRVKGEDAGFEDCDTLIDHLLGQLELVNESY